MQIKIKEVLDFSSLFENLKNKKLPFKTAYKLTQIGHAVEQQVNFYHEQFRNIVYDYAILDENGQPILTPEKDGFSIKNGLEQECYIRAEELQNLEVELPDIKFSIEDFPNITFTTVEMQVLFPFIEE